MTRGKRVRELADELLRAARRPGAVRGMILDIDGTLAPLVGSPRKARIPASVLRSLRELAGSGWRITILTGRPLAQARAMAPVAGIALFGSFGIEREGRGIPRRLRAIAARLHAVGRQAAKLARRYPGVLIENKPAGIAFHDRRLSTAARARWRRALRAWLGGLDLTGVTAHGGKRAIELRPAGAGKSSIVQVWRKVGPIDRSLAVIGDDGPDEELFVALRRRALTIRVGGAGTRTAAIRRLPSPAAVARFLSAVAEADRMKAAG